MMPMHTKKPVGIETVYKTKKNAGWLQNSKEKLQLKYENNNK